MPTRTIRCCSACKKVQRSRGSGEALSWSIGLDDLLDLQLGRSPPLTPTRFFQKLERAFYRLKRVRHDVGLMGATTLDDDVTWLDIR